MRHRQYSTKSRRIAILILSLMLAAAGFVTASAVIRARAEGATIQAWVMCQPEDWVNARRQPSTRSESLGRLETGYPLRLDGKTKNGFARAEVALEESTAWVYAGYISMEEPIWQGGATRVIRANGRVACRKYIDGPRRCWVTDGSYVRVWWETPSWCVTDKGFIRTEFIQGV